jgi:hypothetical protein
MGSKGKKIAVQTWPHRKVRLYLKNKLKQKGQVVENLPRKSEALNSNLRDTKRKFSIKINQNKFQKISIN